MSEAAVKNNPMIAEVQHDDASITSYSDYTALRDDILSGKLARDEQARKVVYVNSVAKPGKWTTVQKLVKSNFQTRCLYEPIMAHAMKGFTIGWVVGFFLKSLDSAVTYFTVNPTAGVLWIIFVGLILISMIPSLSKANMGAMVVGFLAIYLGMGNLWLAAIAVGIVAFLGVAPFGMAVGSVVGLIRKRHLPSAPDAKPEGSRAFLLSFVLPILWGAAFIALYLLWLNPLLYQWLGN